MQFKLFGRNLQISGDDWFIPGIIILLFRFIWIPIMTSSFIITQRTSIVLFLFAWTLLCTINEAFILFYSGSGTINNRKARKPLFLLIPLEFLLRTIEFFILIPSMIEAWSSDNFTRESNHLLQIMTTGALLSVVLFFFGIGIILYNSTAAFLSPEEAKIQAINRWEKRIKSLLKVKAKLTKDQQVIVTEAAKMMSEKFPSKWATTDFSIAIWILSKEQLICRQINELDKCSVASSFDHGFAFVHKLNMGEVSLKVAREITKYQERRLAQSQTLSDMVTLEIPRPCLIKSSDQSSSNTFNTPLFSKHSIISENMPEQKRTYLNSEPTNQNTASNPVKKNIADILHFAKYSRWATQNKSEAHGYESHRISALYVSNANSIFEIPFLICLDHEWKAVVISCRGTQSIDDVLVDIKIAGSELDGINLDPQKHRVRSGFLKTAKNVYRMILESGCLESVFENPAYADYRLVCTGHSLGAATSSILTYLFRNSTASSIGQYSSCICYAFACPAFASPDTAKIFEEHTISIICGHDLIPRLSYLTWHYFIQDTERILSTCSFPKHKVLLSMIIAAFSRQSFPKSNHGIDKYEEKFNLKQKNPSLIKEEPVSFERTIPVELEIETSCIPGKILYLEKLHDFQGRFKDIKKDDDSQFLLDQFSISHYWKEIKNNFRKGPVKALKNVAFGKLSFQKVQFYYTPRWASKEEFHELILSRSTFQDHSNLFDILKVYEQEDDDEILRAALII